MLGRGLNTGFIIPGRRRMRLLPTAEPSVRMDPGRAGIGAVRPRIVFLGRNLLNGGAERAYLLYVNRAQAVEPVSVLLRRTGSLVPELDPRIPSYDLSAASSRWSTVRLLEECRALTRVLAETEAHVVSSFLMRSHLVAIITKLLFRPQLRIVLNVHEHMTQSAEFLYPTRIDRLLMRLIARYLFPRADRVVAVAEGVRQDLVETYGLPLAKVIVVHNPLDIEAIRRQAAEPVELPRGGEGPWIAAAGRLIPLKGFDVLVNAFALLPPGLGARLMILGEGPERARLAELIDRLGLARSVFLLGEQANPWKYMARASVFAHASLTEAFPNVIGEALTLRVPVVATDCSPGVLEYLEDGRCGVLVPPRDPASLAEGLVRLLGSPELRDRLAERGWERVQSLGLDQSLARYEAVLCKVAAPRVGPSDL